MLRLMKPSLFFLLFTLSPAFAGPDQYHRLAREGIALGHNMQIDKAEEIFNEMIALDPDHPLGYLAQALINLYRYRLEERHKANAQKFKENREKAIKLSKKTLSKAIATRRWERGKRRKPSTKLPINTITGRCALR